MFLGCTFEMDAVGLDFDFATRAKPVVVHGLFRDIRFGLVDLGQVVF
jgi:hypothetical protein